MSDNTIKFDGKVEARSRADRYMAIPATVNVGWYHTTLTPVEPEPVRYQGKLLSDMTREELEEGIRRTEREVAIVLKSTWPLGLRNLVKEMRAELATRQEDVR